MIVNKPNKKKKYSRYSVFYIIMGVMFSAIMFKLLYLQGYKYEDYKEKADIGSTRLIEEKAPRGNIYDSEGNVLATNKQNYVLTYMQTDEATEAFYTTMNKVFTILKENNEKFQDDLLLKINSSGQFYFDFKTQDFDSQKAVELRFKKDRGLNEIITKNLFEDVKGDLTDEQLKMIDDELLKITPEETFYYLVHQYDIYEMLLPDEYTSIQKQEYEDKYKDFTGEKSIEKGKLATEELRKKFSVEEIRNFMVVKDAIKMQSFKGYKAVTIANNIKRDTAFIIYQKLSDLPGIDVALEPVRYYPFRNLGAHVLGYVSSIDSSQEEKYELQGYDASTDLIGVSGIEGAFEDHLRGNKGGTTVKVNSQGRLTEELFKLESYPGNNIHLTIDKDVQYAAEQGLKDTLDRVRQSQPSATRGAVVALEVDTGRVIAMASFPDYDPNDFAIPGELSDEKFEQYFSPDIESFGKEHIRKTGATMSLDQLFPKNEYGQREDFYDIYPRPMFNYATLGKMPPGSVYKPLTAIAGLMEGVISTTEIMNDATGRWQKADLDLENFGGRANGPTNLRYALQMSSNYFFYETDYRLWQKNGGGIEGLDALAQYSYKFGLGVDPNSPQANNPGTGIEIEESFGQTYNFKSWKNRVMNSYMFSVVDFLNKGKIKWSYNFIPMDIGINENDTDELKKAKEELKAKMNQKVETIGTENFVYDAEGFAEEIKPYVINVMNNSDSYKANVKEYESENKTKVKLEEQAQIIALGLSDYIQNDMKTEIVSNTQIIIAGIGQGMNTFTPLQLANYVATLANGGTRYKVSLVDKITTPTGEVIQEFKPEVLDELNIPDHYLQAVKEGMRAVNTYSGNGMAYETFGNFPIAVCGKTGTADFGTEEQYSQQGRRPNGNYISFAPMDDPKIAIFSTLYDGNKGSDGAPVHKAIYEAYFAEELLKIDPSYASRSATFKKYVTDAPKDNIEGNTTNITNTTNN